MKTLLENLEWSVRALAQPAAVQAKLFPTFVPPAEELALTFDDYFRPALPQFRDAWTDSQIGALIRIDAMLTSMSGPGKEEIWLVGDCLSHPQWSEVRGIAAEALAAFRWSAEPPSPSDAIYVRGRKEPIQPPQTTTGSSAPDRV